MFFTIDEWLIQKTSWIMRQLELFTSFTHKGIVNFLLFVFLFMILVLLMFGGLCVSKGYYIEAFFSMIDCSLFSFVYYDIKKFNTTRKANGDLHLSLEKTTRKMTRIFLVVITIFVLVRAPKYIALLLMHSPITIDKHNRMVSDIGFTIWALLEYVICTQQLPPGEKEKREEKIAMRDAIPVPN